MLRLYFTDNINVHGKLNGILCAMLGKPYEIKTAATGKPYIEGDPLFFSLSHSGGRAVIAISDKPVGVDAEALSERKHESILKRFSLAERAEITSLREFLAHWVVREAYAKFCGDGIFKKFKLLEYVGGELNDGGKAVPCIITVNEKDGLVYALCTAASEEIFEYNI